MSNLLNCKACGKEIAKGVKKCPNCGKDQRNYFMRHKFITFIGAVVIIGCISVAAGGGGSDTTSETASTVSTSPTKKAEKVVKIGDTVKKDNIETTITKVENLSQVGTSGMVKKASDGGTLIAVQYTIKNVDKKPLSSFSIPTAGLVGPDGTEYDADIDATSYYSVETNIDNSKILSDLNPGIKVTDVQVFEVSKADYAKGKWLINLNDKKVSIK